MVVVHVSFLRGDVKVEHDTLQQFVVVPRPADFTDSMLHVLRNSDGRLIDTGTRDPAPRPSGVDAGTGAVTLPYSSAQRHGMGEQRAR